MLPFQTSTSVGIMQSTLISQIFKWISVSLQYLFEVASSMSYHHTCLYTSREQKSEHAVVAHVRVTHIYMLWECEAQSTNWQVVIYRQIYHRKVAYNTSREIVYVSCIIRKDSWLEDIMLFEMCNDIVGGSIS